MQWVDVSSPGATRRNKKTFQFVYPKINLIITNDHAKYPQNWIMNCPQFGINNFILKTDILNEADAKLEAIEKLYKTCAFANIEK